MPPARRFMLIPIALTVAVAAGCGEDTVKTSSVESEIRKVATQAGISAPEVACPDDIEAKRGSVVTCAVTSPDYDKPARAVVVQQDDEGGFDVRLPTPPNISAARRREQAAARDTVQAVVEDPRSACDTDASTDRFLSSFESGRDCIDAVRDIAGSSAEIGEVGLTDDGASVTIERDGDRTTVVLVGDARDGYLIDDVK